MFDPSALPAYRLAIATCHDERDLHPDDATLLPELAAEGVTAQAAVWNDPAVDWAAFDAVLIRSTWDYVEQDAAFQAWVSQLPVPLFNAAGTVLWNRDKRYLHDLSAAGVSIIPTQIVPGAGLLPWLQAEPQRECVVKPVVSASARHTLRGQGADAAFCAAVAALPAGDYLVQPFMAEVQTDGEWSLVFIAGEYSHTVRKFPAAGDFRVQPSHGGSVAPAHPDAATIQQAASCLAVLPGLGQPMPLYARVDGIVVDGQWRLMELELIEPLLHLRSAPGASTRLAQALVRRLAAGR